MRRLATLIILATSLMLALGCQPPSGQQPDDIVPTPGGMAYRANVHQQGVKDLWPSIETSEVVLADNVIINYRSQIETSASESRNNIIFLRIPGRHDFDTRNLNFSASNVPAGIEVKEGEGGGGLPGTIAKVLIIEISKNVQPGEYTFDIGVEYDGKDYGKIPCTIKVIQD